jgi:hypothetical protein
MFDAQCDLAALVYDDHEDPDAVLRDFAAQLNAHGFRAVGMVQAGQRADSSLSAVLVHNGEKILLAQDFDPSASGCRLDLSRLQNAGARVAEALEAWWHRVSAGDCSATTRDPATVCEIAK